MKVIDAIIIMCCCSCCVVVLLLALPGAQLTLHSINMQPPTFQFKSFFNVFVFVVFVSICAIGRNFPNPQLHLSRKLHEQSTMHSISAPIHNVLCICIVQCNSQPTHTYFNCIKCNMCVFCNLEICDFSAFVVLYTELCICICISITRCRPVPPGK